MYFRDPLTPEQRKQLDDYKNQTLDWSSDPRWPSPRSEFGDRPRDIIGGTVTFIIALVLVMVAIGFLVDEETTVERLRTSTSCDEVLDIMAAANKNAGIAELAHIRYDELGCGL